MKYLIDTDICIFALRQRMGVLERLLHESPDDIAVGAMTEAELTFGAIKSAHPERAKPQIRAFLEPVMVRPRNMPRSSSPFAAPPSASGTW